MFRIERVLLVSCTIIALSQAQISQQINDNSNKKLKVRILYETLCPDSVRFISNQLGPNYADLEKFIDVELVPFGKSYSEHDGGEFYCQHGPAECEGNRKQSCVLDQTENQDVQVKFVVCAMTHSGNIEECAESYGLRSYLDNCVTTQHGTQIQLRAEEITKRYQPSFVPTIIYNDVFDQELQDSSMNNFRGTVCRLLQRAGILDINSSDPACA